MQTPTVRWDPDDPTALLAETLAHFRQRFKEDEKPRAYLAERGLGDPRLAESFGIGYADRSLGEQLPPATHQAGKLARAALAQLGVIRPSGHGHFNGSIVIPVTNPAGAVVQVYGRKIGKRLRAGTERHTFLHDEPRGIFNLASLSGGGDVILCPSVLDALSFWVAGYHHSIACFGMERADEELARAISSRNVRRAYIAFRRTTEADEHLARVTDLLASTGIEVLSVEFPRGRDANDVLAASVTPETTFGQLLRAATWLGGRAPNRTQKPASAPTPNPQDAAPSGRDEHVMHHGDRRYRVRGLSANLSYSALRVNVMVSGPGDAFHVDTLDLYAARQRQAFTKQAAGELHVQQETIKADLGRVILQLEEIQDERIRATLEADAPLPVKISEEERREAMALLRDPQLIERLQSDLAASGVIGESTNRLLVYLAATSRKLEAPLAVVVQSSSSAGKSALMNSVLALMPPEDLVRFSTMTAQSLYYMGEHALKHRILAIAEEEGAERASYPLKLLQSEGELRIASPGKDAITGRIRTQEYRVEGPVMILMTTTATDIDEELLNRCIVLAVDEGREQTRAIHDLQRRAQTLDGLLRHRDRDGVRRLHRNAQRLIRPMLVVNPFAERLTFLDDRTRTRRDHMKYLTLIRAIALLHQHQRTVQTVMHRGERIEYIEATADDVALANELARQALDRSLDDLAPQSRRLLTLIAEMVEKHALNRFSRRDAMTHTGWSYKQLRTHLRRLVDMDYLGVGRQGGRLMYELRDEAAGASPALQLNDVGRIAPDLPPAALGKGQPELETPQGLAVPLPSCPESDRPSARSSRRTSESS